MLSSPSTRRLLFGLLLELLDAPVKPEEIPINTEPYGDDDKHDDIQLMLGQEFHGVPYCSESSFAARTRS
jgi:hypothetical protein